MRIPVSSQSSTSGPDEPARSVVVEPAPAGAAVEGAFPDGPNVGPSPWEHDAANGIAHLKGMHSGDKATP